MPHLLRCAEGHRWELGFLGASTTCPQCGRMGINEENNATNAAATISAASEQAGRSLEPVPSSLPDFEIESELGRGGMGVVYKARQISTKRLVAIKVIRQDRLQHEESVRRFRREAQAAARLLHPNIVHVFDSDHTGDTHYLVMEFVDGITLDRLVSERGPLSVERACDVVRQAALGLQHAHEQALVHRDIKPSNLMITPQPGRANQPLDRRLPANASLVKLLDMGVARVLQLGGQAPGESLSTLTQGGAVIGTADYVAPEQLENPHNADIRADLYSLGCTFYFLLTGHVPFPGGTLVSKLDRQRWETPTSIHQLREEVPPAVAEVVHKLMSKNPDDRFATPAEVARTLEKLARTGYTGTSSAPLTNPRRLHAHTGPVWAVAFAPDGAEVLSAGKDRIPRLWDTAGGTVLHELPVQPQEIRAVAFSPDGASFCTVSGVSVRLWDRATRGEVRRLVGHAAAVRCAIFLADGKSIASAGDDKTVRIFDLASGREMHRFARHTASVTGLALVANKDAILSCSRDQSLRLWDVRNGHETGMLASDGGAVLAVATCSAGSFVLSSHFDTSIRLWDLESAQEVRRYVGHKQMVTTVTLLPDDQRFLSASQDGTARLWDLADGRELACLEGHQGGVHALAVSPDGKLAVSVGADSDLCLWELPL